MKSLTKPLPCEDPAWLCLSPSIHAGQHDPRTLRRALILPVSAGKLRQGSQASLGPQGRGTKHYGLIVVGHSLGAGTAAILSFLLRPQYPTLKCFAYSPPGGLLR